MMEKTLIVIKPDGVQRNLIGEIISRYERTGLKLVALKMMQADENLVEKHYTIDPDWKKNVGTKAIESYEKKGLQPPSNDPVEVGEDVLKRLKIYICAAPVVAMVWQGNEAVKLGRKICGSTESLSAEMGTIRGDYSLESYQLADGSERAIVNLVHASGSVEEADQEIALWFTENEILNYKLIRDTLLYDKNWTI
ncbi:MAG: nucleoside-diphosphate kinase [Candidatus Buchananbacteria bacterium]|nr:nucleoside-diphosphate kinase [Candidatus Buchananbacteria bacterium]